MGEVQQSLHPPPYAIDHSPTRTAHGPPRPSPRATPQVSPPQYVQGEPFAGGTWLVWRYNASLRFRFNLVRGDNQVVSAVMFD